MEVLKKKCANLAGIQSRKVWSMDEVRNMCIKHNFYNAGNNDDYTRMLYFVDEFEINPTLDDIYTVASDIFNHTEIDESWSDFTVSTIMFYLEKECITTFYYTADEYYN